MSVALQSLVCDDVPWPVCNIENSLQGLVGIGLHMAIRSSYGVATWWTTVVYWC